MDARFDDLEFWFNSADVQRGSVGTEVLTAVADRQRGRQFRLAGGHITKNREVFLQGIIQRGYCHLVILL
jgi:hypothetical protein